MRRATASASARGEQNTEAGGNQPMNLTDVQIELLTQLVELHLSDRGNNAFEVMRSHAGTYLRYPGRPSVDVAGDMLDFQALESEGLVTLSHGRIGLLKGKVTQKGIDAIAGRIGITLRRGHPAGQSEAQKQFGAILEARQTGTAPTEPTAAVLPSPPPLQSPTASHAEPATVSGSQCVFIGHGRTYDWMALKEFLEKELKLKVSEFNSVPVAGYTTAERLQEMLNSACFALLVMTGEDEHADGTKHARENVIHEIGLFQGKLGLKKAIVLIDQACEGFSNVAGVNTLRFPKHEIHATFEQVRQTLKREGIIS